MTTYSNIEREAIVLNAIWDMIDEMVNFRTFVKFEKTNNTNVMFQTSTDCLLFNILLVDFLSQPQSRNRSILPFDLLTPPSSAKPSDFTHLFYLKMVCEDPKLGTETKALRDAVDAFSDWLEASALVPNVWFPSISTELDIKVPRLDYIKICGDIAKHNFMRLQVNVGRICRILEANGHPIDEAQGYTVLGDFFQWFHKDIFVYHSSSIAAFLNNIRWAISEYLTPEFLQSIRRTDELTYAFSYPTDCKDPLARGMYWDLMNRVRSKPYFPQFTVNPAFSSRY